MKIISGGRGYGKTLELIKISAETGCYIVTRSHDMARAVAERARAMGYPIPFPLTYDQFKNPPSMAGMNIRGLIVDDVDALVQSMTATRIYAATFTDEADTEYLHRVTPTEFKSLYQGDWPPPDNNEDSPAEKWKP